MIQEITILAMASTNELFTLNMAVLLLSRLNKGLTHGVLMGAVHHWTSAAPSVKWKCSDHLAQPILIEQN